MRHDVQRSHPLWVYDDDDWKLMHGDDKLPLGDLICPEPGCRAELVAVEVRKTGTRFLRNRPGTSECGHALGRAQSGGPPSAEHRWLQQRLAEMCGDLGHSAIQEHYESRADVWVHSTPPLAIEVQRWPTAFADRSRARQSTGANVLWLLPESASSQKAAKELFRQPAARVRVFEEGSRHVSATPWNPGHSDRVWLSIGATVMRPSADGLTLVSAGNYDAKTFLREVLDGRRRWFGPREVGFKYGSGWARPDEVEQMRAARARVKLRVPAPTLQAWPALVATDRPAVADQAPPTDTPPVAAAPSIPGPEDFPSRPASGSADAVSQAELTHKVDPPTPSVMSGSTQRGWFRRFRTWLTGV